MAGLGTRLLLLPPPVAAMGEVSMIEVGVEVVSVLLFLPPEEVEEASGPKNLTVLLVKHLATVSGKTANMLSGVVTCGLRRNSLAMPKIPRSSTVVSTLTNMMIFLLKLPVLVFPSLSLLLRTHLLTQCY